ncbi:hypothetical protein F8M49_22035 [Rhodococcus zopfii]|uniref:Uncharacterized protein n=1 Tax=Rhodococcus zopfii TaxID=43772 RepID=A0ABU3WTP0_9NOCA|nr:hypothetical protein [Rhodococcus zopfii]
MPASKRTVLLRSVFYRDADGAARRGRAGQEIDVHEDDDVARFDSLNVLQSAPAAAASEQAPVKPATRKTARRTSDSEE